MRSLVFCTSYAATQSVWDTRYRMWLAGVESLGADQVLVVDDGSETLPGWPELQLYSGNSIAEAFTVGARAPAMMYHFTRRLGRVDLLNFPGWHRSFVFAALFAEANGFDRVIHIESDAFLLSEAAHQAITTYSNGWAALYAPEFDMPESAVQVAAGDGLRVLAAFARQPYEPLIGHQHERLIPFTHIAHGLKGARVCEIAGDIPADLDYAAQVPSRREACFYHWLPGHHRTTPENSLTLNLLAGGDGLGALGNGWADAEPRHHWMVGAESVLNLPALPGTGPAVLKLGVTPHVYEDKLTSQRLILEINGHRVRSFDIPLECVLGCDIPPAYLHATRNVLRLIHPDGVAPKILSRSLNDARRLSVSVEWVTFER
jgi:hypothetical protein